MEPIQNARELWVKIEGLFQANKEPRAIFLRHEFHSMTQSDLSVSDYCQRMKTTADALRDVDHPVSEPQLVLNLLRSINRRFCNTADHISTTKPLPFTYARDQLVLKELRLANEEKVAAATALVASGCSCRPGGCRAPSSTSLGAHGSNTGSNSGSKSSDNNRRRRNNGRRSGGGDRGTAQQRGQGNSGRPQPTGPWFCFNPWAAQQGGHPWRIF